MSAPQEVAELPSGARSAATYRSKMDAGHFLRITRRRLGVTQKELGNRAGVSHAYIGRIERGETGITVERLAELVAQLGVELTLSCRPLRSPTETGTNAAELLFGSRNGGGPRPS
jgi:transcriptional regulator with XRE-family HTH domain